MSGYMKWSCLKRVRSIKKKKKKKKKNKREGFVYRISILV
jgi:hypothetical protein